MAETGFQMLFPLRKECVCCLLQEKKKKMTILGGKMLGFVDLL